MNLPDIALSFLPHLDSLVGIFGSLSATGPGHDDSVVIVATFVYESSGPMG